MLQAFLLFVEYLVASFPVVCLGRLLVVLVRFAHHLILDLKCLLCLWYMIFFLPWYCYCDLFLTWYCHCDIVPIMILLFWYYSYHDIVIVICSYHDIVSSPEWILVHLHRVKIGVRVASLSLCVEGNGSKVCSKDFLGEKHDWNMKNFVVVYLIARAAVIVPNWKIGNGLWHLEVKKGRCQKSFSCFSVTVSQF